MLFTIVQTHNKDREPVNPPQVVHSFAALRKGDGRGDAAKFLTEFEDGEYTLLVQVGEPITTTTRRVVDGVKPTRTNAAARPNGKKKRGLNPAVKKEKEVLPIA